MAASVDTGLSAAAAGQVPYPGRQGLHRTKLSCSFDF